MKDVNFYIYQKYKIALLSNSASVNFCSKRLNGYRSMKSQMASSCCRRHLLLDVISIVGSKAFNVSKYSPYS